MVEGNGRGRVWVVVGEVAGGKATEPKARNKSQTQQNPNAGEWAGRGTTCPAVCGGSR